MTVKELKEAIANLNDDTIVYVEADHGQCPYQANYINITNDNKSNFEYNGEDIDFNNDEIDVYEITAILIS